MMSAKIIDIHEHQKQKQAYKKADKQIMGDTIKKAKKATPCPQCGADAVKPHSPFCSRRCAQIDLGRWLNEDYRIPAHEAMDDNDIDNLILQLEKDE